MEIDHATYSHGGVTFEYSPNMTGIVTIRTEAGKLEVRGDALIWFLAEVVRNCRIVALDNTNPNALLGTNFARCGTPSVPPPP